MITFISSVVLLTGVTGLFLRLAMRTRYRGYIAIALSWCYLSAVFVIAHFVYSRGLP